MADVGAGLQAIEDLDRQRNAHHQDIDAQPARRQSIGYGQTGEGDYSLFSCIPGFSERKSKFKAYAKSTQLRRRLTSSCYVLLTLAYVAYLLVALHVDTDVDEADYWCEGDGFLLFVTGFLAILVVYFLGMKPLVRWVIYLIVTVAISFYLYVDTSNDRRRLQSLVGLFLFILLGFVFSVAPKKVIWRQVIWGLALQFILGVIVLRWPVGRKLFECTGRKLSQILLFTQNGSNHVFGPLGTKFAVFAFKILPTVIFFSFCVKILYYIGIMQWIVIKLGWLMQATIGTTPCESVIAAASIFLSMSEAPLLIRPFIHLMTMSELHAVMTGGFATIAGSVMAAYISFGVSASHLLSASVMSAPAALAYSKLFYPETEVSKTSAQEIPVVRSDETNVLHAAVEGVVAALPLVANIAANLITFIAFIAFFNAIFDWSCVLVGADAGVCTLQNVFGYIFMPLAWSMGVPWDECHAVGTLLGLKTIVNEFVAYSAMSEMIKDDQLSTRSQVIATYALCGFSNLASMGIQLGVIGALAPERRTHVASIVFRAMIAGSAACFMTACIAGVLLGDESS
ncbi:solute carrier family 28 member 3-like [Hyalella azteca]|uniref:Sodium/nucleoside cotransporter n=1 Tax=Hyalella azteca TaxID=294128 RepID=A0A8B7P818_HYAAZ|nr:solute carrier family 28 member 3-like [Hyalella azteca]